MSVNFIGAGTLGAVGGTSVSLPLHVSTASGDMIILICATDSGDPNMNITSTGYVQLPGGSRQIQTAASLDMVFVVLYKWADASEPAPTIVTTNSNGLFGFSSSFRNVNTDLPFDGVTPVHSNSNTAPTGLATFTPTGISTGSADALVLSAIGTATSDEPRLKATLEQGFTRIVGGPSYSTIVAGRSSFALASKNQAVQGAVIAPTFEPTQTGSAHWIGTVFSMRSVSTDNPNVNNRSIQVPHVGLGNSMYRRRN